VQGVKSRLRVT
jgi:hypothetical protein